MPNFLENTFAQLLKASSRVVLREIRGTEFVSVSGAELLDQIARARAYMRATGLQAGDCCALLGPNSIRWAAIDLALMAEGIVVVPLYSRKPPAELTAMMKDCTPRLLIASDAPAGESVAQVWPAAPPRATFDGIFQSASTQKGIAGPPNPRQNEDLVTIIYTSGTSGEPKGVCLNTDNVSFMLQRTTERLDQLMRGSQGPDSVFHYLPLNFAASWIATLSFLSRESVVTLSTDLNRLADEIRLSAPHYFLNVPTLLERVRRGVDDAIGKRPSPIRSLYARAHDASQRDLGGAPQKVYKLWLPLGRKLIFRKIKQRFGPNLRALICGSAPLAPETQNFFGMLGVPVLQVYGLTETTGICTMDDQNGTVDTGHVGPSIDGIEMKITENEEIVVRGPNVFPGYWNREEETARVLEDGWFRTGDQGEKNPHGNWRIIGRVKNLIILNSSHKIPPEPIENKLGPPLPPHPHTAHIGA